MIRTLSLIIPSFVGGLASVLDLGNTLTKNNFSKILERSDYDAIQSDWITTGKDIKQAIEKYGVENAQKA